MTTEPMGPFEKFGQYAGAIFAGGVSTPAMALGPIIGPLMITGLAAGGSFVGKIAGKVFDSCNDVPQNFNRTLHNINDGINNVNNGINNINNGVKEITSFGKRLNSSAAIFNGGILLASGLAIWAAMKYAGLNCYTGCTRDIELIQYAYTTLPAAGVAAMLFGGAKSIFS